MNKKIKKFIKEVKQTADSAVIGSEKRITNEEFQAAKMVVSALLFNTRELDDLL